MASKSTMAITMDTSTSEKPLCDLTFWTPFTALTCPDPTQTGPQPVNAGQLQVNSEPLHICSHALTDITLLPFISDIQFTGWRETTPGHGAVRPALCNATGPWRTRPPQP